MPNIPTTLILIPLLIVTTLEQQQFRAGLPRTPSAPFRTLPAPLPHAPEWGASQPRLTQNRATPQWKSKEILLF
jgi:hypothetical protein